MVEVDKKMKQLKFNMPEILPSLLNKTKTTTIRKAWDDLSKELEFTGTDKEFLLKYGERLRVTDDKLVLVDKPPKYKVGDVVEVVWTGTEYFDSDYEEKGELNFLGKDVGKAYKILGKVKIIKREEIEIDRLQILQEHSLRFFDNEKKRWSRFGVSAKCLAESEGFKSVEIMFEKLEEYADGLEVPKKFYLYTCEWLK